MYKQISFFILLFSFLVNPAFTQESTYDYSDLRGYWTVTNGIAFPFDSMLGYFSDVDTLGLLASVNLNSYHFKRNDVWWKDFSRINDSSFSYMQLWRYTNGNFFYAPGVWTFLEQDKVKLTSSNNSYYLDKVPLSNYQSFNLDGTWQQIVGTLPYEILGMKGEVKKDSCIITQINSNAYGVQVGDTWWKDIQQTSDSTYSYQQAWAYSNGTIFYRAGTIYIMGDDFILLESCETSTECGNYYLKRIAGPSTRLSELYPLATIETHQNDNLLSVRIEDISKQLPLDISLTSLNGSVLQMKNDTRSGQEITFNTGELSTGIYLLSIKNQNKVMGWKKIIIH